MIKIAAKANNIIQLDFVAIIGVLGKVIKEFLMAETAIKRKTSSIKPNLAFKR